MYVYRERDKNALHEVSKKSTDNTMGLLFGPS